VSIRQAKRRRIQQEVMASRGADGSGDFPVATSPSCWRRLAFLALAFLLSSACIGAARAPTAQGAHSECQGDCRLYRGEPLTHPECRVPEDCGGPPHTQTMQCISGGRCQPVCEHYWGDCDRNFRNGCEQSIADRHYCPGDARIGARSDPSVAFFIREERTKDADTDRHVLARSLAAQTTELERCYRSALTVKPQLGGEAAYRLIFSERGRAESVERLETGPDDQRLMQCAEHAVSAATIDPMAHGEVRIFVVEVVFAPGGPDEDGE
jgi:hypothetical protein